MSDALDNVITSLVEDANAWDAWRARWHIQQIVELGAGAREFSYSEQKGTKLARFQGLRVVKSVDLGRRDVMAFTWFETTDPAIYGLLMPDPDTGVAEYAPRASLQQAHEIKASAPIE